MINILLSNIFSFQPENPLMFNSILFFVLFSAFYLIYAIALPRMEIRNFLLLVFSLFFYYKISGAFILLLIAMGSSDYFIAKEMSASKSEKTRNILLYVSIFINIGSLLFYKYTQFLLNTWLDITVQEPISLNIIQPLGISFFVFKSLTYIFDIHREIIEEPEKNHLTYLLYVSFFPNILAGPIAKARNLLPQFHQATKITSEKIGRGFFLIMSGLFYKIVIADFLAANFIDRVFDAPTYFTGFEALMAAFGAMIQIYYDFAGYTNIVLGIALLLGFEMEINFRKPFLAKNITEFWRRWHITLSTWFNEYLFTPLSFYFRKMKYGAILAILITFFVSGLWHGAAFTYILWGLSHGLAIAWDTISVNWRKQAKTKIPTKYYNISSIFLTFLFLSLSVVLFKSADMGKAGQIYSMIFTKTDFGLIGQWFTLYLYPALIMIFAMVIHYLPETYTEKAITYFTNLKWYYKAAVLVVFTIIIYQVYTSASQPFIYLEF